MCYIHNSFSLIGHQKGREVPFTLSDSMVLGGIMDAIAVTIVIIAVVILVVMTGIGGYALGRASAADDAKKASEADRRLNETLVGCRDKVAVVCGLLNFQVEQTERYAGIARQAVKALPGKNVQNILLERKLREADNILRSKIAEVEEVKKG